MQEKCPVLRVQYKDYMNLEELRKPWHLSHAKNKDFPYASRTINGNETYMHRYIMGLQKGDKRVVDHLNGQGQDNRRENLEIVPASINLARSPRKRKEHRGVHLEEATGKFRAKLLSHDLIRFDTKEEAALAVNIAKEAHYGTDQKVRLNQIPEGVHLSEEQKQKVLARVAKIKAKEWASRNRSPK